MFAQASPPRWPHFLIIMALKPDDQMRSETGSSNPSVLIGAVRGLL